MLLTKQRSAFSADGRAAGKRSAPACEAKSRKVNCACTREGALGRFCAAILSARQDKRAGAVWTAASRPQGEGHGWSESCSRAGDSN